MRAALAALALLAASPALALADARVERDGDSLIVRWTSARPVDVRTSTAPDAPARAATLVSPADGDGQHRIAAPAGQRLYVLLKERGTGQWLRVAERLLPLEAGSNFRDIGGYPAAGGRHVRWGLIYRSAGQPLLTAVDQAQIARLGLANLVDLRSAEERRLAPTRIQNIRYNAVGYSMAALMPAASATPIRNGAVLYRGFPTLLAPHLRLVFDRLLNDRGGLAYNCSAGQDRTGFVTAMILSALGVPRDAIMADYALSADLRRPEFEMPRIDPAVAASDPVARMFAGYQSPQAARPTPLVEADGTPFLAGAFAEIMEKYGSVDAYLAREAGLTPARRKALQAAYLE
ncbi:MAG: tyrosine-protein phosphatase [Alphaproteobacteria bacterium]|nr:tyrosine-protein phosphatase [Alphaproteobacteria bacterium]